MKKMLVLGVIFALVLGVTACGGKIHEPIEDDAQSPYIADYVQSEPLPTTDITVNENQQQRIHGLTFEIPEEADTYSASSHPVQQISPLGRQVAIEFLSKYTSIFQNTIGLHDLDTRGFYALTESNEWANIDNLPLSDIPLVFQGGVRSGISGNCYTDTWGVFFNNSFYDVDRNLITNVPFIREPVYIEYSNRNGGVLATNFTLFDLNDDGIPEIIIEFRETGVSTWYDGEHQRSWGYRFSRPFILYSFIDGAYQEVAQMPSLSSSAGGYLATLAPIFLNHQGEIIIFADDGHRSPGFYHLKVAEGGMELHEIVFESSSDFDSWRMANFIYVDEFLPLTDLKNEITKLITS